MGDTRSHDDEVERWATSGAMTLTGRPGADPLGPPEGLVDRLHQLGGDLARAAANLGGELSIDPLGLLGERAAITGMGRGGAVSCGGGTRLVPAADGWIAVSLVRSDDLDLIPAWLGVGPTDDANAAWQALPAAAAHAAVQPLVERAGLLGLAVAGIGDLDPGGAADRRAVVMTGVGPREPVRAIDEVTVVDLSSLWAGPLATDLLAVAGARVIKVESVGRPDGARSGPAGFFDLMNHRKASVALDFSSLDGRRMLAALIARADVVVEGSRPRALRQLGITAEVALADGGVKVWLSITGHGRTGRGRDRVAYGDDAAVAGGLVASDATGPCFCADAVADPLTGLTGANAVLQALSEPGAVLLDAALASVAAGFAGPTLPVPDGVVAQLPTARTPNRSAPNLGADTATVMTGLGLD